MKTTQSMLMLCAGLFLAGCHPAAKPESNAGDPKVDGMAVVFPKDSPQLGLLKVEAVEKASSAEASFPGRIVWDDNVTARVYTPFAGRLTSIAVDVGGTVKTGTELVGMASPDFGQAQADASRAESDALQADRALNRTRELFAHGAAAQKDLQAAEADHARADAERDRANARLRLYGGAPGRVDQIFHLVSPVNGTVVERNVNPGQEVRSDQMLANVDKLSAPLFVITDPARVWVLIDVAEQELGQFQPGMPVKVSTRVFSGEVFAGTVEQVSPSLDPVTRMIRVRASVKNPQRKLRAEMLVNVELPTGQTAGLEVPVRSVFLKGEKHFVYCEQSPGHFTRQSVTVGAEQAGKVIVLSGLESGQHVVSDGCLLLEQIREGDSGS